MKKNLISLILSAALASFVGCMRGGNVGTDSDDRNGFESKMEDVISDIKGDNDRDDVTDRNRTTDRSGTTDRFDGRNGNTTDRSGTTDYEDTDNGNINGRSRSGVNRGAVPGNNNQNGSGNNSFNYGNGTDPAVTDGAGSGVR